MLPWKKVLLLAATLGAIAGCSPPTSRPTVHSPPPKATQPATDPAPAQLDGMTREQVAAMLGHPGTETAQGMAIVWNYQQGDCLLSLVFYPEVGTAVERVLSHTFRDQRTATACLRRLREERAHHAR